MDFAIGLVNSVLNLPGGQVMFFEELKLEKNCEINSARQKAFGASWNDVSAFSLPKWQAEKWFSLHPGIQTLDLCDTSAALYQLSQQAIWEQVVELVHYKPVKEWWWSFEYMKIIYVNCGVKN